MIPATIRASLLATCLALAPSAILPADAQRRSSGGEQELARVLNGRIADRPVNCISLRAVRSTRIIGGTAILYDAGRTIYVNRPRSGAESLKRDDVLLTRTSGSQLCSIDTVRLADRTSHFPRGFVTLDKFVPYRRASGAGR